MTSRSRTLTAALATALLAALLAAMALAASGSSTPVPPTADPGGYGYGPDTGPCSYAVCRWIASGRVTDAATGAPLAGATVTLQQRAPGGAWGPAADVRPAANPQVTDRAGRFTWLARGGAGAELRVLAAHAGHVPGASAVRALRGDGYLDVALSSVTSAPGDGPGTTTDPAPPPAGPPAPSAPPVSGTGHVTPRPPVVARPKGCAAKRGRAQAACLRAARLAKALKACRVQKGARRKACERRARALAACDAKKGRRRAACRTRARAIGHRKAAKKPSHRR